MEESPSLTEVVPQVEDDISVKKLIGIGLITRLLIDTAVQMFFPFLPIIAEGMGTTTVTLGRLVSLRSSMGLLAPLFGVMADRRGYRLTMRLGLLLGAIGYTIVASSNSVWLAAIGMIFGGLGTFSFVPTLQAYVSTRLSYRQRAKGLGILEYSWALSGIIGLFLVGRLIAATNWRVPLYIIAVGMFIAAILYGRLPSAKEARDTKLEKSKLNAWQQFTSFFVFKENQRSTWSVLFVAFLIMLGAMTIFINYGTWLAADYSADAATLGTIALIIGLADLSGSVLASTTGDRVGKRRSLFIGLAGSAITYFCLPFFDVGLVTAVFGLLLTRIAFEYGVVNILALASEQVPSERGKVMSMAAAAALLGSTIAGFFSPTIFENYGLRIITFIPVIAMIIGLITVYFFVDGQTDKIETE